MGAKRVFGVIAVIFIALGVASAGVTYVWLQRDNLNYEPVVVDIQKGDTLYALANRWEKEGWVESALSLRIAARLTGAGRDIRAGEFIVPPQLNNFELLSFLASAPARTYRLTLIEGRPLKEAVAVLASAEHLKQDLGELSVTVISDFLGLKGHYEAQLYPDTYVYHRNEPVSSVIRQAHERLQKVLEEEWQQKAASLPYKTPYDALIMASIIEKETGVASERPVIAGVFVRRLQKGMRLETDPTVIYGLGDSFEGNLTRAHLRDSSNKYNTYRNKGLPPGPIALAGRAAINAALHPAPGTELYFVAKGDGSHYFSSTLSEHNDAVRRFQLRRREDYRSAPPADSSAGTDQTEQSMN
ncbi:MAG: endolytic transglycosylase MltG [Thalassolituus sp.]